MPAGLLKPLLWIWLAGPFIQLVALATQDALGSNPQEVLLRALGQQILVLLLVVLSLPLLGRHLVPGLLACRRMVGLWAFFYGCLHLLAYAQFEHDLRLIALWADAFERPFVTVGLLSLALMLPLALTSNRASMRWLGPTWKRLHQLVWPIVLLGLLHYFLHKAGKNDFEDPAFASAVLLLLIGARRLERRRGRAGARPQSDPRRTAARE